MLDDKGSKNDPQGYLARYEHAIKAIKDINNVDIEFFKHNDN